MYIRVDLKPILSLWEDEWCVHLPFAPAAVYALAPHAGGALPLLVEAPSLLEEAPSLLKLHFSISAARIADGDVTTLTSTLIDFMYSIKNKGIFSSFLIELNFNISNYI